MPKEKPTAIKAEATTVYIKILKNFNIPLFSIAT
ncbi:hypothetical protein THF5H11_320009 [Vibrio jasicida]|nr:hypothetical protein THF5H11_320009 [Vibrio jasicida]